MFVNEVEASTNGPWWPQLDLVILVWLALMVIVIVAFVPMLPGVPRSVLGLVFVVVAPGYALAAALFPGRDDVDVVERWVVALGLSFVATPLAGLVLNSTSWGLKPIPLTVALAALVMVAALVAWLRRSALGPEAAYALSSERSTVRVAASVGLAAVAGVTVVVLAAHALRPVGDATAFYVVGATESFDSYPTSVYPGEEIELIVGVRHFGADGVSYTIVNPGLGVVTDVPVLDDGASWQATLTLLATERAVDQGLVLELYRRGDGTPYRTLRLLISERRGDPQFRSPVQTVDERAP